MTDGNHPITPPQSLISERRHNLTVGYDEDAIFFARWGADQELEACCELLDINGCPGKWIDMLRAARRPKPPSLKEQALAKLEAMERLWEASGKEPSNIIRCALEALPD